MTPLSVLDTDISEDPVCPYSRVRSMEDECQDHLAAFIRRYFVELVGSTDDCDCAVLASTSSWIPSATTGLTSLLSLKVSYRLCVLHAEVLARPTTTSIPFSPPSTAKGRIGKTSTPSTAKTAATH